MTRKTSIKAVCIGLAIGLIGSMVTSVAVAFLLLGNSITVENAENLDSNNIFLILHALLTVIFMFLSGYVAARIGKEYPMHNSIIVGLIQFVMFLLFVLPGDYQITWQTAAIMLILVPAVYWGGKVASKKI
ncbi:MAG: hypothetical protein K0R63_1555 [Rickettsiales bacterium]|jgi:1-acyl-sn-glycerol-3-phosphate acyltransferase|nr:hypothetical protein [Rickettsiales bacterium]